MQKIETNGIRELSASEMDLVAGGDAQPTMTVAGQNMLKIEQELKDAYLKSHPIHIPPIPLPH